MLHLCKRDADSNQHRFYRMLITRTLFGRWALIREWGRIGSPGRQVDDWFETGEEAETAYRAKEQQKRRRGYV